MCYCILLVLENKIRKKKELNFWALIWKEILLAQVVICVLFCLTFW